MGIRGELGRKSNFGVMNKRFYWIRGNNFYKVKKDGSVTRWPLCRLTQNGIERAFYEVGDSSNTFFVQFPATKKRIALHCESKRSRNEWTNALRHGISLIQEPRDLWLTTGY